MLKEKYKDKIAFVGGVDLRVLIRGTEDQTCKATREMIDLFKGEASYMLGSSNVVTPYVKPENLKVMLETLGEYG